MKKKIDKKKLDKKKDEGRILEDVKMFNPHWKHRFNITMQGQGIISQTRFEFSLEEVTLEETKYIYRAIKSLIQ